MLEICGAVDPRDMRAQYLDSMDIERERGITIKLQSVRLDYRDHVINLIDTPGHVDFGYEVSRSLAACEGVILRGRRRPGHRGPDAGQLLPGPRERPRDRGRAQQDRPAGRRPRPLRGRDRAGARHPRRRDPAHLAPRPARAWPSCSTPSSSASRRPWATPTRRCRRSSSTRTSTSTAAWCSSVRVMNGRLRTGAKLRFMQAGATHEADEVGVRTPTTRRSTSLGPGEVGYLIAGIKDVGEARSGETVTEAAGPAAAPLDGLPRAQADGVLRALPGRRRRLRGPARGAREAAPQRQLLHLRARDLGCARASGSAAASSACCTWRSSASASSASSTSNLIATAPSVEYRVITSRRRGRSRSTTRPTCRPVDESRTSRSRSSTVTIITPSDYTGTLMDLCQSRRGEMVKIEYLSPERVELQLPDAAGRGRHRLLRPDEEPHPGLRQPRLRADRLRAAATW